MLVSGVRLLLGLSRCLTCGYIFRVLLVRRSQVMDRQLGADNVACCAVCRPLLQLL